MDDKDRAELGLPPLLRPRGNRNFQDASPFTQRIYKTMTGQDDFNDAVQFVFMVEEIVRDNQQIRKS